MTKPNRHLPYQAVHIVRRTSQRQYLLKNDVEGQTKNDLGYLYALAARDNEQIPYALMMMDNHTHICQMDTLGTRSRFKQIFFSLSAKVLNQRHDRQESVWSSSRAGDTVLLDTQAVIDTVLYVLLNPVKAGLVERVADWDHFKIMPKDWEKPMRFKRPDYFRTDDPTKPDTIEFTPQRPPGFDHLPLEEVVALFEGWIREREDAFIEERAKASKSVIDPEKHRALSVFATPKTPAPKYQRNPPFCGTVAETMSRAFDALSRFWGRYKEKLEVFRSGQAVVFPAGSIRMRLIYKIACEPLGHGDCHIPIYAPFNSG